MAAMHLLISVMLAKKYQKCIFFPYYIYIKDAVRIKGEQLEKEVGKGVLSHRLALQVQKCRIIVIPWYLVFFIYTRKYPEIIIISISKKYQKNEEIIKKQKTKCRWALHHLQLLTSS